MAKQVSGRKSTEMEYEQKMVRVFELIVYEKKSYTEFRDIVSKEFDISTRAAENMWQDCRNRLKERFSQEREEILSEQLNRLYDLLNRSRLGNNRRVEAEVLRDISKIYGLDQPVKVDITSGGEPISLNIILDKD
jgi:tRNA A37 N6-isopentenylltransferase MiaA